MQSTTTRIDTGLARNLRTFAALCTILASPVGGIAIGAKADYQPAAKQAATKQPATKQAATSQSEKRKIIRSWQGYFRAIRTLEYAWAVKNDSSDELKGQNTLRYAFLWNGERFRLDTDFPSTKQRHPTDDKSAIITFDGKFYRSLQTTLSGTTRFTLNDPPAEPIRYHSIPLPLISAFLFVFDEDKDSFTLDTLQKDAIWQRFEKRISHIEQGAWQGRRGHWLLIEDPEYAEQTKIFVDGASNFPLFVAGIGQYQLEGKDDTSDAAYDSQVTRTMKWREGKATYVFPLQIVRRDWSKDVINGSIKRTSSRSIKEVTAPVKINQPLKATRFHFDIPAGTLAYFVPTAYSKRGRPYPFVYDPKGGSLWAQEQRQRQRIAQLAALPKIYDEKADGKTQIEKALKEAQADNKRVLLQFGENWCGPCHRLHDLLMKNPEIAGILKQDFVVANIAANDNLVKQYRGPGQDGVPFMVVLAADGKRLAAPPNERFGTTKAGFPAFDPQKIIAFLRQWQPKPK